MGKRPLIIAALSERHIGRPESISSGFYEAARVFRSVFQRAPSGFVVFRRKPWVSLSRGYPERLSPFGVERPTDATPSSSLTPSGGF